jgi:nucleotide-binding universal stress UspA family protein
MAEPVIVVPTDFSQNARTAYATAAELAKALGGKIELIHVRESPVVAASALYPDLVFPDTLRTEINAASDEGLARIREEIGADLVANIHSVEGTPAAEVTALARKTNASYIVMATHGHSALARLLLGSTAERIVRSAPCPVVTCRPHGDEE